MQVITTVNTHLQGYGFFLNFAAQTGHVSIPNKQRIDTPSKF